MAWTEDAAKRTRHSRTYTDTTSGTRRLVASLAPLHYDTSGTWEPIDLTPQRVTNAQLDGWAVTNNGWTYALGQRGGVGADGWVGFGRKGHAFWFRLARYGYVRTTNLAFQDVGGAASYTRANLSSQAVAGSIGPNADPITTKSVAQWDSVFPGVNLRWVLHGNQLKEEVVITAAARAALPPPSTPASQTWFVAAFQVDWSDVPKRIIDSIEVSAGADSGQITGPMELRTVLDETIAFLPVDEAYVGTDLFTRTRVTLRKRFYTQGGQTWLVVGMPVNELTALPAGDLVLDPTVNENVAAGGDDGSWYTPSTFDNTSNALATGHGGGSTIVSTYMRFQTVAIPAGATISSATFTVDATVTSSTTTVNTNIYCEDADDTTAPTSYADATGRARTTAFTAWDNVPTFTSDADTTSPSFASALQEVIDRAGWASGNDLTVFWQDDGSSSGANRQFGSFEHATRTEPRLTVDYTSGATFAPVVVAAGSVTAAVKSRKLFSPTVTSASTITALVRSRKLFTPATVASSTVTAAVRSRALISLSVAASSSVTAALRSRALLSPVVSASSTVTAALRSRALLSASVASSSTVTATLSTPARLSPAVVSASTVTAEVSVPGEAFFTVTVVSASTATATVTSRALFAPAIVAASTAIATVRSRALMVLAVTSASTVTALVRSPAPFAPSVVSSSTVAAALRSPAQFAPLIVGNTSASAVVMSRALFVPTISAAMVVAAALRSRALISVTVTGTLVVTAAVITEAELPVYGAASTVGYQTTATTVTSGDGAVTTVTGQVLSTTTVTGST